MEWNDVLRDVSVRFKYRSWLLFDLSPQALASRVPLAEPANDASGVALLLDCSLEGMFRVVDELGPGISYAASLQTRRRTEVPAPVRRLDFQDFKWAC